MQDAAKTLQHALELGADAAAAYNLLVCCYALGDTPAMQDNFQRLVQVGMQLDPSRGPSEAFMHRRLCWQTADHSVMCLWMPVLQDCQSNQTWLF